MHMRLYPIDDAQHSEAADLLPWFANGTLDERERAQVEWHLADCIACKQDLAALRDVQAMYSDEAFDHATSQGLARLRALIARLEPGFNPAHRHVTPARKPPLWWQALLGVQAALILLLAATFWLRYEPRYYHTLAAAQAPAPAGAAVVVIFDAARSEGQIRELLRGLHARVVDGPTAEGAYTVAVPWGEQARALTELRQHEWVRFAEPAMESSTP
jgi:anti-sigma factor RsiW